MPETELTAKQMTNSHTETAPSTIRAEIERARDVIRRGGVILYPTDTVWGIGCDATNSEAVKRIYEIKRRADHKAMIVLVDSPETLDRWVDDIPEVAFELLEAAVDPTTIVFDHGRGMAPELLGPGGSIGVRVTSEAFSRGLCRAMRRPLVSTSANISGMPTAAVFPEISPEIINAVDYVVDYRRNDLRRSKPSSVIALSSSGVVKILRP